MVSHLFGIDKCRRIQFVVFLLIGNVPLFMLFLLLLPSRNRIFLLNKYLLSLFVFASHVFNAPFLSLKQPPLLNRFLLLKCFSLAYFLLLFLNAHVLRPQMLLFRLIFVNVLLYLLHHLLFNRLQLSNPLEISIADLLYLLLYLHPLSHCLLLRLFQFEPINLIASYLIVQLFLENVDRPFPICYDPLTEPPRWSGVMLIDLIISRNAGLQFLAHFLPCLFQLRQRSQQIFSGLRVPQHATIYLL